MATAILRPTPLATARGPSEMHRRCPYPPLRNLNSFQTLLFLWRYRVVAVASSSSTEIYADLNHSSYDALKFAYGVLTTFTPSAGIKIIQSYMERYRQDWRLSYERDTVTKGGWQQGGLLVAGPGTNNILFIHKGDKDDFFHPVWKIKSQPMAIFYNRNLNVHQNETWICSENNVICNDVHK